MTKHHAHRAMMAVCAQCHSRHPCKRGTPVLYRCKFCRVRPKKCHQKSSKPQTSHKSSHQSPHQSSPTTVKQTQTSSTTSSASSSSEKQPASSTKHAEDCEIIIDGENVGMFHGSKRFRSVNVVRALKYYHNNGMKPLAFVPRRCVDFRFEENRLADDPCVLKLLEEHGFVCFIVDDVDFLWHVVEYAAQRDLPLVSNRKYKPSECDNAPENVDEIVEIVERKRVLFTFDECRKFKPVEPS